MGSLGRIKCLIISLLSVSISSSLAKHNKIGLTTTELNERYGQGIRTSRIYDSIELAFQIYNYFNNSSKYEIQ